MRRFWVKEPPSLGNTSAEMCYLYRRTRPSFCTKLGTNIFESINGGIAANPPEMSDFSLAHHPRAQMAMLKRVVVGGHVAVANALRSKLNLPPLSRGPAKHASDRERKGGDIRAGNEAWSTDEVKERPARERKRDNETRIQATFEP